MKNVVRLGDLTSHGGAVISVRATHMIVDGVAVACVGDKCSCPVPGHGVCTIIEGDPTYAVDGLAVVYDGHKTSCGATLIASVTHFRKV